VSVATLSVIGRSLEVAVELVRVKVDVIVGGTDLAIAAVKRQTRSIPIVMDESSTASRLLSSNLSLGTLARIAFKLRPGCERR